MSANLNYFRNGELNLHDFLKLPLKQVTYSTYMDDPSETFMYIQSCVQPISVNACLIIFIIFVLFWGKTEGKKNLLMAHYTPFSQERRQQIGGDVVLM